MARADGMTCAANASLISTMSMSSMFILARLRACLDAPIGPRPMNSGSSADRPVETTRASGLMPSSLALRSDITTTAAAPSLSGHAFPAVTVPSSRNAGFSVARTDRGVLALHREAVLLLAADLLAPGHVLRGLAHRDVDVGILLGVARDELRVVRVGRV